MFGRDILSYRFKSLQPVLQKKDVSACGERTGGTGVRREGSSVAEQGSLAAGASAPAGAAPAGGVTFPMRGKSPKAHQGTFRKVPWTFRARGPAAKRWARVQPSSRPREKPRGGFPHWILLPSLRGLYEGWGRLRLNNPAFKRQILRITSSSPPPRQGSLSEGAWLSRPRRSGLASLGAASSGAGVDGLLPQLGC